MFYPDGQIVEAMVTKSRPGQSLGLDLEECKQDSCRVYVADILDGLFRSTQALRKGDELLEINGIPISKFPNGLSDVHKFLQGEWSINLRVRRSESETLTMEASRVLGSDHSTSLAGGEPLPPAPPSQTTPKTPPKRRGRRKSRESLGSLIQNVRSSTPSGRSGHGPRRGKRPGSSSHSRSTRSRSTRSRSKTKKDTTKKDETEINSSTHSRSTRSRSAKRTLSSDDSEINNSNHGSSHSRSSSRKSKVKKRDRKRSKELKDKTKKTSENSSEHKIRGVECSNSGVTLEMKDGNRVSVNPTDLMALMIEEDGKFLATSPQKTEKQIRGVECTNNGVTLEMKDGNRVTVNPIDLMALMTEEDGKFLASSHRTMVDRPILEQSNSEKALAAVVSDDEEDDDDELYDTVAPNLHDLRSLLSRHKQQQNNKTTLLSNMNDCSSVENPWTRRSTSTLLENQEQNNTPTTLRRLLGERLRTTQPKKWEESSMVSSTLACMTNLIDPGDLMKIHSFSARPGLNGATVEVVCKSSTGANRWEVRIIQRKNQRASDSSLVHNHRLISVAAANLRHFV